MSAVLSVITARYLVHVSDAPGDAPRSLVLRYPNARGLLTLAGPLERLAWLQQISAYPAADPASLADRLKAEAALSLDPTDPISLLYSGWGYATDGREITFRYLVSNQREEDGFGVEGATMAPTPAGVRGQRGGGAYSLQVAATVEQSAEVRQAVEALPKQIRKGEAMDVALAAAEIVRRLAPGPVCVAHLDATGALEAAVIDGARVLPLVADADTGASALRPAARG